MTAAQKTAWDAKQNALTFDSTPTANSSNPVTSGGVYTALNRKHAGQYVFAPGDLLATWTDTGTEIQVVIPDWLHGIEWNAIVASFYERINGAYVGGTANCQASWAEIDGTTHDVTLHLPGTGYIGKAVFYG